MTFYSIPPFPGVAGAAEYETYLSTRGDMEWSTQGLLPKTAPEAIDALSGLTEDLSLAIVVVNPSPGLEEAGGGETVSYIRDDATGTFELLGAGHAYLADATSNDARILFEDRAKLTESATAFNEIEREPTNLYELDREDGHISLVDVLPQAEGGGPAPQGAVAGPGGHAATEAEFPGGATAAAYTQNTISENGSRMFFTALETGRIYVREPEVEPARTVAVSPGQALFLAATPDGRYVFYLEDQKMFRVDLDSAEPSPEPLTTMSSPGVQGLLGVSDDGDYAYFVAKEVLAINETEHENSVTHARENEKAESGDDNLYEWHVGTPATITFIAGLSTEDHLDWGYHLGTVGAKTARVTPDGQTLLFASFKPVTGYQNRPAGGCEGGRVECDEAFLYEAEMQRLRCVSCNPNASVAEDAMYLNGAGADASPALRSYYLPRNLSDDGNRVFFDTKEALVSGDVNGVTDVYEWERAGTGSCGIASETFSAMSGGCVYLISTGTSSELSYFGDASANGDDIFFFTYQSLVSQDQDSNSDLYDARVAGGLQEQNPAPATESCEEEGTCRPGTSSSPVFGTPSSSTLSGSGNLSPPPESTTVGKPKIAVKSRTRAEELAQALKRCAKKGSKKEREACRVRAKRRYGWRDAKNASAQRTDSRRGGRS